MNDSAKTIEKESTEISSNVIPSSQKDQESIIDWSLDIINIKKLLTIIFSKTPIKVTDSFISGIILLVFLIWIFNFNDHFTQMIVIIILSIFLTLEILVKNVDKLKRILFSEDNNNSFLDNLQKYSIDETKRQSRIREFTSGNVNHYLKKILADPNIENGFILENIVSYSDLSIENFNILFSDEFLKQNFLRQEIIIRILMRYKDSLSQLNLLNLYNNFKTNDEIQKYIFATQIQSEFLVKENPHLNKYYEKFQVKQTPEFFILIKNLPNLSNARQQLFSKIISIGFLVWFILILVIIYEFSTIYPNFILSTGVINPSFSLIFFIVFLITSLCILSMIYILWKLLSDKIMKKWTDFMDYVTAQ